MNELLRIDSDMIEQYRYVTRMDASACGIAAARRYFCWLSLC